MNPFILRAPHLTEKSYRLIQVRNEYTFIVDRSATKGQIKEAVESTFGVKVLSVHTTMISGKNKRTGKRRTGVRQPDKKKAIVALPKEQKISLFDIESSAQKEVEKTDKKERKQEK